MTNNRSLITLPENRPEMLERLKKIPQFAEIAKDVDFETGLGYGRHHLP